MKLLILTALLLAPLGALRADEARPSPRIGLEVRDGVLLPEQDKRFAKTQSSARPEVLRAMQEAAQAARKPLFVGEFGVSKEPGPAREKEEFAAMLRDFELAGVPLAAVWVFDLDMQDKDWNITSANARSYMLKAVAEANRRWQQTVGH